MAELAEKQFELDGVVFGWGCDVDVLSTGFRPGGKSLRTSDAPQPVDDGTRMGVDYRDGETWGFSLFTSPEDEVGGWEAYAELKRAWDADNIRTSSGTVTRLRYKLAGQTRCVYGRPRRWDPAGTEMSAGGLLNIEADFLTVEPQVYDDETRSVVIGMGAPLELDAGIIVPFIPPFVSDAGALAPTSQDVVIEGDPDTKTWVTVEFIANGGVLDEATVFIGDWRCQLRDPVPANNSVTVDPRPWQRTALLRTGGGVPLNPRVTQMRKMWLSPGRYSVVFNGLDATASAQVKVSWQNARRSPR